VQEREVWCMEAHAKRVPDSKWVMHACAAVCLDVW
jgi:hypothetical protein